MPFNVEFFHYENLKDSDGNMGHWDMQIEGYEETLSFNEVISCPFCGKILNETE